MKNYSNPNTLKAIATLMKTKKNGDKFFADEFGFSGSVMNSLNTHGFVYPTGNTKSYFIHLYGDTYKKVTVNEWSFETPNRYSKKYINNWVDSWFKLLTDEDFVTAIQFLAKQTR